jgi:hypothetical protein
MSSKKELTASEMGRMGGRKRAEVLSAKRRSEIAKIAAKVRWSKRDKN